MKEVTSVCLFTLQEISRFPAFEQCSHRFFSFFFDFLIRKVVVRGQEAPCLVLFVCSLDIRFKLRFKLRWPVNGLVSHPNALVVHPLRGNGVARMLDTLFDPVAKCRFPKTVETVGTSSWPSTGQPCAWEPTRVAFESGAPSPLGPLFALLCMALAA